MYKLVTSAFFNRPLELLVSDAEGQRLTLNTEDLLGDPKVYLVDSLGRYICKFRRILGSDGFEPSRVCIGYARPTNSQLEVRIVSNGKKVGIASLTSINRDSFVTVTIERGEKVTCVHIGV
jgi:hypothetical protein